MFKRSSSLIAIWLAFYTEGARCSVESQTDAVPVAETDSNIDIDPDYPFGDTESIQFSYIDELTNAADLWSDQRKFDWLKRDCDFTSECGFGSVPGHAAQAGTWKLYKENLGSETTGATETSRLTTGLGYRSHGPSETYLFSDPVPCLEAKTASVRAKVRLFGNLNFRICLVSLETGAKQCGTTIEPRSHKYSTYNLEQSIMDVNGFSGLAIIRVEFIAKSSAFILIEKITYAGQRCFIPHGQKERDPTEVMKFQTYKLKADSITMQSIIPILQSVFDRFIPNLDTYKVSTFVAHLCISLPCHTTNDLCLYKGQYGSIPFEVVMNLDSEGKTIITDRVHGKAVFKRDNVDFAIFASEKYVNDATFKDHKGPFYWRFLANEAVHKRNVTVCFLPHSLKNDRSCVEPVLDKFHEETKFYSYTTEIPVHSTEFRLVIWQPQNFKFEESEAETIIRGINVIGC